MKTRTLILVLAILVLTAPAGLAKGGKKDKPLAPFDYEKYFAGLKRMQAIADVSNENIRELNKLMKELLREEPGKSKAEQDARLNRLRAQVRKLLTEHRKLKVEMIALCDRALKKTYTGKKDVAVLHRLAFPSDVLIRIEDADGVRPTLGSVTRKAGGLDALRPAGEGESKLAQGLSWNGDAFDRPGPIRRSDLLLIEPGCAIEKTFDLAKLLATGLTPGRYRVYVGYRNYESGDRFGYPKERRAPVGIVWSKPVAVTVK